MCLRCRLNTHQHDIYTVGLTKIVGTVLSQCLDHCSSRSVGILKLFSENHRVIS
jgi:hypothetical protein